MLARCLLARDPEAHLAGPLEFDMPPDLVASFLMAPPIDTVQAAALGAVFERDFPALPLPRPRADLVEEIRTDPPVPGSYVARVIGAATIRVEGQREHAECTGRCRCLREDSSDGTISAFARRLGMIVATEPDDATTQRSSYP